MKIIHPTTNLLYLLAKLLIVSISTDSFAGDINPTIQHEMDSIVRIVKQRKCAVGKYNELAIFFWKYAFSDYEQVEVIGEQAYEVIKNNAIKDYEDARALSDGYDVKGFILEHKNQFDSAYYYFNKALATATPINYKFRICWSYIHFGRIDYLLGNYRSALINMKEAEKRITTQFDSVTIFTDFANIYEQLGNYDSAFIYYNKKLGLYEKNSEKQKELSVYLEIVNFYKRINNFQKSLKYLNIGLKLAENVKDNKALIQFYEGIGDFFCVQKKNYDIALEYYRKALEKCSANDDVLKPGIYNQIGNIYLAENKCDSALIYNLKSLDMAKRLKLRNETAHAYENLAHAYKKLNNVQSALYNFKAYFTTGCLICNRLCRNACRYNEIADLYMTLNRPQEALAYYLKALELAQKFKAKKEIAISYLKFGNFYIKSNQQLAEKYYLSSLSAAKDAKESALILAIADTLSHYYYYKNNRHLAYQFLYLARTIGDSLSKTDKLANTADLELKFEFEKLIRSNETQQILAKEEIKRQVIYRNSLLLISALFGLLGIVIWINYKRKKTDNLRLNIQKNEIANQKNEIEKISQKLHEADQAKLKFFTNISHEFRTPLTLILGPVEKMIKKFSDNQDTMKYLSIIQRNSYLLYDLINQLLDIRKLDAGNIKLKIVKGDIMSYVKGIYSSFIHLAEENKVMYTFTADSNEVIGWFDADILEKIINNLLSNAFKFTSKEGEICVIVSCLATGQQISHIKIEVCDNGKGISHDQLKYVFDRYYQVENYNTGLTMGTGIGLAYTKELIELHKGEIQVQSLQNQKTIFTVTLPVNESCYDENEKTSTGLVSRKVTNSYARFPYIEKTVDTCQQDFHADKNEKIILIIEDNSDLRTFIKSIFNDDYSIYEADNGLNGYHLAEKLIPDIIISDIMMPQMDGLELCSKLKSNIHTNHIPLLLLTAKSEEDHEILGLKTGADDYLTKPFTSEVLIARVDSLLRAKLKLQEYFTRQFLLNPKEIKLVSPEDEFLKKAVKIVEDNISNPELNIDFLVKTLGISRAQLFRKVRAVTNYSVNELIRNIRLKRAAQLLFYKSTNISDVVYMSGFNSPSYFTACFKEMYGCSPKEYALKKVKSPELLE